MKTRVKVLLNWIDDPSDGSRIPFHSEYAAGDLLREALAFAIDFGDASADKILRSVYAQLNVDQPDSEWGAQYRAERNRSLSVGDVIVVGEQAWAVARVGFTAVTLRHEQVVA